MRERREGGKEGEGRRGREGGGGKEGEGRRGSKGGEGRGGRERREGGKEGEGGKGEEGKRGGREAQVQVWIVHRVGEWETREKCNE